MERRTISIAQACDLAGVSRRTIYNWITAGKIESVKTSRGLRRIVADTLWRDGDIQEPAPSAGLVKKPLQWQRFDRSRISSTLEPPQGE
jgi:excisionase family DNA binding protein